MTSTRKDANRSCAQAVSHLDHDDVARAVDRVERAHHNDHAGDRINGETGIVAVDQAVGDRIPSRIRATLTLMCTGVPGFAPSRIPK